MRLFIFADCYFVNEGEGKNLSLVEEWVDGLRKEEKVVWNIICLRCLEIGKTVSNTH